MSKTVTTSSTLSLNNDTYIINASLGSLILTLPDVATNTINGVDIIIIRSDTTNNTLTIQPNGATGNSINGGNVTLGPLFSARFISYNGTFYPITKIINSIIAFSNGMSAPPPFAISTSTSTSTSTITSNSYIALGQCGYLTFTSSSPPPPSTITSTPSTTSPSFDSLAVNVINQITLTGMNFTITFPVISNNINFQAWIYTAPSNSNIYSQVTSFSASLTKNTSDVTVTGSTTGNVTIAAGSRMVMVIGITPTTYTSTTTSTTAGSGTSGTTTTTSTLYTYATGSIIYI